MIKNFLIINCTGYNNFIGLKVDNKFFTSRLQTNLIKNDNLIQSILLILKENRVEIDSSFSIIINVGPGSFSSIRISLSVAKGIEVVKKTKLYSYDSFKFNLAEYLSEKEKIISIQKTNNFYYFVEGRYHDKYTFSLPKEINFQVLNKDQTSIIVAPVELQNDKKMHINNKKKLKYVKFDLKNIEILIKNNLLENKLIKPLYLS